MQFVKILLRDEKRIDKTKLYKVYKKIGRNVITTKKQQKYKGSYPQGKSPKTG